MVIGPATDEEAERILSLSVDDYVESLRDRRGVSDADARAKAERDTRRFVPDGAATAGAVFLAARRGDRLIGGVWASAQGPDRAGEAWLYFLWVDPAERRQGVARRLVEATAAAVRQRGATDLALNVFGDNAAAIALYGSLGFRVLTQQMSRALRDA